jgi:class 3 adenylate cyclase
VSELPSGTVTFLFSDIEGSTRLMQRLGDSWAEVLAAHNRVLREAFEVGGGREVDRQGDAFFAVFPRARDAVAAAVTAQRALAEEPWPGDTSLRVRMGLHTGEPSVGDEGYLGVDVVRASRICALAHGGQILVSEATRALVRGGDGVELVDAGEHALKGIDEPERLFRVRAEGLEDVTAMVPTGTTTIELAPFAGHGKDLAARAMSAMGDMAAQVRRGEDIGPKIEAQVEEMLRSMGVPTDRPSTPSSPRAPRQPPAAPAPLPPAERIDRRGRGGVSRRGSSWLVAVLLVVVLVLLLLDRL